jgi:hypothetical protein
MPKSWKRKRREEYFSAWPQEKQNEAVIDALKGNSSKLNQLHADFKVIKGNNPKPGGNDPVIEHVDRWDALTILRTRNDLIGGQSITVADIEDEIANLNTAEQRDLAYIDFTRPRWYRNHSLINTIATAFGLTETQVNNLFTAAKAMEDAR